MYDKLLYKDPTLNISNTIHTYELHYCDPPSKACLLQFMADTKEGLRTSFTCVHTKSLSLTLDHTMCGEAPVAVL